MAWIKRGKENTVEEVFMRNIGVKSLDEVNQWVKKARAYEYRIDNLKESVNFAKKFQDKPVWVFGDYDVDGITSTTILIESLCKAGFVNVNYRIPKRFSEGFGLNKTMVDEAISLTGSDSLIITCDNGVAQREVIEYAKNQGFSVIIIDHHLPETIDEGPVLPPADYIIDPNAIEGSADYSGYCGAGLSYRFACELVDYDSVFCKKMLGLAAIGTVADVMAFHEENYFIVRYGLKTLTMPKIHTSGLYALIRNMGVSSPIKAYDIAFKIGPALNACSRMNDTGAKDAVEMLLFDDFSAFADEKAKIIVETNNARKKAQNEALKEAYRVIKEQNLINDVPLIVKIENIGEGIIGIIAGKLCEEYKVPAIVVTNTGNGRLKGSARSCGDYHMKKKLDKASTFLLGYGGHRQAAGLSLKEDDFHSFVDAMKKASADFIRESLDDTYYDLEIEAKQISETIKILEKYEPYGEGNARPVFKITKFSSIPKMGVYKMLMGEDENIVKLFSKEATAIGFDMADKMQDVDGPGTLSFVGFLSTNCYEGYENLQIEFTDFICQNSVVKKTFLTQLLQSM